MFELLKDNRRLFHYIQRTSGERIVPTVAYPVQASELAEASAVLFLLGLSPSPNGSGPEPCLILNKRSSRVKQPGDLCCPGGGVMPGVDAFLARTMTLPGLPMWRWPFWSRLRSKNLRQAEILRSLFFTSVREGFEEMRLNPFGVRFLGPLPPQKLVMFQKIIYPMMGWVSGQKKFFPNWEVEKIVYIPLKDLLNPENYVRYQLHIQTPDTDGDRLMVYDAPSYVHIDHKEKEILWGATCKITLKFLYRIFDFSPPDVASLPIVEARMDENYANSA